MGLSTKIFSSVLMTVIALIIVFQVLGDTAEDVGFAADNATYDKCVGALENNSVCGPASLPLIGFFEKKGIILLAVIAGVLLTIILAVMPSRS